MVKYQFGKNWSWCSEILSQTEITQQHLDTAYKINATLCTNGNCKANCTLNPYCLNGLGEKKLTNLIQKEVNVNLERSDYFRDMNDFAGVINLGATCYINTYLQVRVQKTKL
jgi:ubiquitin carboxyl-terminal hydrolase 48